MTDIAFLSDAPLTLAGDGARSRIQVAELGSFSDPRYGRFSITQKMVDSWRKLLDGYFGGQVPIDYDHATDKGGSSEAAGWIKNLQVTGNKVWADVEWTPAGADAVRQKRWQFISPTFTDSLKDPSGKSLGDALVRVALTNNPFLRGMAAVTLSQATAPQYASRVADSRVVMTPDILKLAAALGVDADEQKMLAAISALKSAAQTPDLKQLAAGDPGVVLLSKAEHDTLKTSADTAGLLAERVTVLETERADARFESAWQDAMSAGRLDAKPETRVLHHSLYTSNPDASLKLLAALPVVVNVQPKGTGGTSVDTVTPPGGDGSRFELHARVQAYMLANGVNDYMTALERVQKAA